MKIKKRLFILLFISLVIIDINSPLYADSYDPIQYEREQIEYMVKESEKQVYHINNLQKIKLLLISGNINQSKKELRKYQNSKKLDQVVSFYWAMIHFIEGDHEKSQSLIQEKLEQRIKGYKESCLIQIMNHIYLGQKENLYPQFLNCSTTNSSVAQSQHLWVDIMIKMFLQDEYLFKKNNLSKLFVNLDDLKEDIWSLWFKIAIYYNKERSFEYLLEEIPERFFTSDKIRELIGFIYYRLGNKKLAADFFRDISTVNSENAMGNIYLQQKKWELALGHFTVALNLKNNSVNAVNRLTPLLWKLALYDKGAEIAKKVPVNEKNIINKLALLSAFEFKRGNYPQVIQYAKTVEKMSGKSPPIKILQLSSLASLLQKDNRNFNYYSERSCLKKDPLGCIMYSMNSTWPQIGKMVENQAELDIQDEDFTFEKMTKTGTQRPIDEISYVKQLDIEELDEQIYEATSSKF